MPTVVPVLTPADNFAGRSSNNFGVGEIIQLSFTTNPLGSTAATFGGLTWVVVRGPATVVNQVGNNGLATLTCGNTAGAVTLELRPTAGAPKAVKTIWVLEPSGAVMVREPATGTFHRQNTASAGFLGWIYLHPVNVSFIRTQFREGSAPIESSGSLLTTGELSDLQAGSRHPVMGTWLAVTGGGPQGSRMNGHDTVRSATVNPPFAPGTFTWNIPWFFRVVGSREEKVFTYAAHSEVCDNLGSMTITKKGTSVTHAAGDADSDL